MGVVDNGEPSSDSGDDEPVLAKKRNAKAKGCRTGKKGSQAHVAPNAPAAPALIGGNGASAPAPAPGSGMRTRARAKG